MMKLLTRQGLTALLLLIAAWASFAPDESARAAVISSFSVNPGSIDSGQQSTLDLTLGVTQDPSLLLPCAAGSGCIGYADLGLIPLKFIDGVVVLFSGTGLSQAFTISSGLNFEDFQFSFTYPTPGTYSPSYSILLDYQETVQAKGPGALYLIFDDPDRVTDFFDQGSGPLLVNPAPTPLPGALPLFAIGLGGLGLLGWRRKRKNAAAIAA